MPEWWTDLLARSAAFMPHGHCYLWIPALLWLHVVSDTLIGAAYIAISIVLWVLVRRLRLPFSPVFLAFGLFIGLCGGTHFMEVWTVWNPDYVAEGLLKGATALASVATAIGLYYVWPQVEQVVHAARLSEERRLRLESTNAELALLFERLKQADQLKSQFFANISHELRTPLALILGPAAQMLDDPDLSEPQRRSLRGIVANGNALLKQVNDLLDAAKLEAGRMEVGYVAFDGAAALRRVSAQFQPAAEAREVRLDVDAPETLMLDADADKFERVVSNLLSNALKFTPRDGEVRVALRATDGELCLAVDDSGPGVAVAQREQIFERFRQADGSERRRHGGTGLGLAIVRDFVELHRGTVAVDDSPLGGARFVVRMPLAAPPGTRVEPALAPGREVQVAVQAALHELATEADRDPAMSAAGDPQRPQVLVIEDNADMRRFVAEVLGADYAVVTASDGVDGLQRARALQPDLIVTDLMMPHMSGAELVEAVRAEPTLGTVPILLLSARTDDQLRVDLLRRGAQDYLTKPFLPQELLARSGNLIAAKRAGDLLRGELASLSTDLEGLAALITKRNRQLQTALEAAEVAREQAERASEVKSSFLGMVSHELRTPLSTLLMNLQLFERDGSALRPAERERVDRLRRAARQMASLVEGLLEYTRASSGRIDVQPEPLDLLQLASHVIEDHSEQAIPGVALRFEPPSRPLPAVYSDPRLLRVVLANLLSNALKFTREGSVVLALDGDENDWLLIEVRDTGIGIPQTEFERIFEPFEQLEPVRRKSVPGVGLGLALVRQIVAALGGSIAIDSSPGQGSTFRVRLPQRAVVGGTE